MEQVLETLMQKFNCTKIKKVTPGTDYLVMIEEQPEVAIHKPKKNPNLWQRFIKRQPYLMEQPRFTAVYLEFIKYIEDGETVWCVPHKDTLYVWQKTTTPA